MHQTSLSEIDRDELGMRVIVIRSLTKGRMFYYLPKLKKSKIQSINDVFKKYWKLFFNLCPKGYSPANEAR